jgi:hypothetical protein
LGVARFVVGVFPANAVQAGSAVGPFVDELCVLNPEFAAMWRDNDVRNYGEGEKSLRHPVLGPVTFEYSAFAVDGRPDLGGVIYNPATPLGRGTDRGVGRGGIGCPARSKLTVSFHPKEKALPLDAAPP